MAQRPCSALEYTAIPVAILAIVTSCEHPCLTTIAILAHRSVGFGWKCCQ
jgi:hypothetical protein